MCEICISLKQRRETRKKDESSGARRVPSSLSRNKIPGTSVDRCAGMVSRRPRSAVVLAPLRSSADGVFSSCVNRFYAKCNREMREGNSAPHCLFRKPLVPDDTLSFYLISLLYFSSKFEGLTKKCSIKIISWWLRILLYYIIYQNH